MKSKSIVKILILLCASVMMVSISCKHVFSFGVETHQAINRYLADENSAVIGSQLNDYLKNNIGMQDGVKTIFKSRRAKEWIGYGGEQEDSGIRCFCAGSSL